MERILLKSLLIALDEWIKIQKIKELNNKEETVGFSIGIFIR